MPYLLVMHQNGGCDYTIGCGTKVVELKATNPKRAWNEAVQIIDDHGGLDPSDNRVDTASFFTIADEVRLDMTYLKHQRQMQRLKEVEAKAEAEERANYERLKAKFGK